MDVLNAIGRRKTAVARVYAQAGSGEIIINNRSIEEYFPIEILRKILKQPLENLGQAEAYDFKVNVDGGGIKGQAEAVRLGIARVLLKFNPEDRPALKAEGLLTRDPRMVERKKFGRRKARRAFQFSKR